MGKWATLPLAFLLLLALYVPQIQALDPVESYSIAFGDWGVPTPFHHKRGPSYVLTTFIWDTLAWKDKEGLKPWLASRWVSLENASKWVVVIRQGVKWHDGKPFTVDDVAFTFEYVKRYPLPFGATMVSSFVKKVIVLNETAVEIRLSEPFPDFDEVVLGELLILPKHIWENVTNPWDYNGKDAFVGTGPYRLVEYKKGEYYHLEANRDYMMGEPIVKELYLKAVGGPMQGDASLALKSNDVDAASFFGSEADVVRIFYEDKSFKVLEGSSYWVLLLLFNCDRYPFTLPEFRRSFAFAINRSEIVDKVLHGGGEVASLGITHPESKWYAPDIPNYKYDPEKAREILDKLGFVDKDGDGVRETPNGTKLSFTLLCVKKYSREAELIKKDLANVGIKVSIKPLDVKPMDQLLEKGGFYLAITGHGGVSSFWPGIKSTVDWPAHTYKNEKFYSLFKEFYTTTDDNRRKNLAHQLQKIIAEDLPVLPLYYPKTFCVYSTKKPVDWYWTPGGIANGIPLWWNKAALLQQRPTASTQGGEENASWVPLLALVVLLAALSMFIWIRRREKSG